MADGPGYTAKFTNNITGDRVVNIDDDKTITNIVFGDSNTSTAGSWTIANNGVSTNNLILAGSTPTITVNTLGTAKTATISAIIEGTAGLTKAGVGTLVLSGTNNYTGETNISAGKLQVASNVISSSSTIKTGDGATLETTGGVFTLAANQSITGTGTTGLRQRHQSGPQPADGQQQYLLRSPCQWCHVAHQDRRGNPNSLGREYLQRRDHGEHGHPGDWP